MPNIRDTKPMPAYAIGANYDKLQRSEENRRKLWEVSPEDMPPQQNEVEVSQEIFKDKDYTAEFLGGGEFSDRKTSASIQEIKEHFKDSDVDKFLRGGEEYTKAARELSAFMSVISPFVEPKDESFGSRSVEFYARAKGAEKMTKSPRSALLVFEKENKTFHMCYHMGYMILYNENPNGEFEITKVGDSINKEGIDRYLKEAISAFTDGGEFRGLTPKYSEVFDMKKPKNPNDNRLIPDRRNSFVRKVEDDLIKFFAKKDKNGAKK